MTLNILANGKLFLVIPLFALVDFSHCMSKSDKLKIRNEVKEMFYHAYHSYMDNAYPADELMPLSCKGRYRGTLPSRGDVDDIMGNFSMTLVDSFDTLVILDDIPEFERAVKLVIRDVTFDRDIVVSVFETNIRMLGGLLSGHVLADNLKKRGKGLAWYRSELLDMAKELGYRLLPAFNTSTGIPFPRVNLMHGVKQEMARTGHERDTCTACAGTMLLEFAALSRLTNEPIFEAKAHKAMDSLWQYRHRTSNLVGTVINIHNGEWVRKDAGIGAGIDSYYEYLLKAYILLGDDTYLDRFNLHYESIMKYVNQGPLMVDVHMHRPHSNSKNFMDSLFAFWPGLQVLKGDIKPAIEIHEMLYQVIQRHNFLPEAFTTDFRVHWAQHPLRPEFIESTYFLYRATGDPHYLDVGKKVIDNLNAHARVACGYAALKDVTTGKHEDQMESFVLSETFKYLFLLFAEEEDLIINIDDYVFTTEAHLLPLTLSLHEKSNRNISISDSAIFYNKEESSSSSSSSSSTRESSQEDDPDHTCPNSAHIFKNNANYAHNLRSPLRNMVENVCPKPKSYVRRKLRIHAREFMAGNLEQVTQLKNMGVKIVTMADGRVQLLHTASEALSTEDAEEGMLFMQEMIELSKTQAAVTQHESRVVQILSEPHFGNSVYNAGTAQFGYKLQVNPGIKGGVVLAQPESGCTSIENPELVAGMFAIVSRGSCMFVDKARNLEAAGALGGIVIDNNIGSSSASSPVFAMSGDGKDDLSTPMVFLFHAEGALLKDYLAADPHLKIYVGKEKLTPDNIMRDMLHEATLNPSCIKQADNKLIVKIKRVDAQTMTRDGAIVASGTWYTTDGQALFRIEHLEQEEKLEFQLGEQAIQDMTTTKRASLVERVVELIQGNNRFVSMDLQGQSDYLFSIGKLMESCVNEKSEVELEKRLRSQLAELQLGYVEVLDSITVSKSVDTQQTKDLLQITVSNLLDDYIEEALEKIYTEAEEFLLGDSSNKDTFKTTSSSSPDTECVPEDTTTDSIKVEDTKIGESAKPSQKITTKVRFETDAGETKYASFVNLGKGSNSIPNSVNVKITIEDLKNALNKKKLKDEGVDSSGKDQVGESDSHVNVIMKPPSWMVLKDDEIFVDSNGKMYANFGADNPNDEPNEECGGDSQSETVSSQEEENGEFKSTENEANGEFQRTENEASHENVRTEGEQIIDKEVVHRVESEIKYGSLGGESAGQTHDSSQSSSDHDSIQSSKDHINPPTSNVDKNIPYVEFDSSYKDNEAPATRTENLNDELADQEGDSFTDDDVVEVEQSAFTKEDIENLNNILSDLEVGESIDVDLDEDVEQKQHTDQSIDDPEKEVDLSEMLQDLNQMDIEDGDIYNGGDELNKNTYLGDETEIFDETEIDSVDNNNNKKHLTEQNNPTFNTDSIAQTSDDSSSNKKDDL